MIDLRPFATLGHADHGWLDARHHFAFAGYRDPQRQGWGRLRVWNDDAIAAGHGFPPHGHRDMEIVTFVRDGAITHGDNLGNRGRTPAGEVQVMSAGDGIVHSEANAEAETTRIFQIWIEPDRAGGAPWWDQRAFPLAAGGLVTLASGDPDDGAATIRADARVMAATLREGESVTYALAPGRHAYLVPAAGVVEVGGVRVNARDGAAIADEPALTITAIADSEIVLVDTR